MGKNEKFQSIKLKADDLLKVISQMELSEIKQIDIDLLRSKITDIYDETLTLKLQKDTKDDVLPNSESEEAEVVSEPKVEIDMGVDEKPEVEVEKKEEETESRELNLDFQEERPEKKEEKSFVSEVEFVRENDSVTDNNKKIIGESFHGEKTLNDLIKEVKKDKEAGMGLNFLKIDSLSHAISINDKIEFVRELFKNDANKYNDTIAKINKQKNIDSAISVMANLDFNNENPTAKKFINLVYRRFLEE